VDDTAGEAYGLRVADVSVMPIAERAADLITGRPAARLCRMAGADTDAIPGWIEEGRRRSANARRPPFSG